MFCSPFSDRLKISKKLFPNYPKMYKTRVLSLFIKSINTNIKMESPKKFECAKCESSCTCKDMSESNVTSQDQTHTSNDSINNINGK